MTDTFANHLSANINVSATLNANFYSSNAVWEKLKENAFARNWGWVGDVNVLFDGSHTVQPFTYYENYLHEPLLLCKQPNDGIKCLSNICTHRGYLLVDHPQKVNKITCGYHGRRFNLEGKMEFMPEFKEAENFPRPCDHLHELPLKQWNQFLFTRLEGDADFASIFNEMDKRVGFLPISQFRFAPELSQDYLVHAHWALYCDNYLEGFHIPYVHHDLNKVLDYGRYETICYNGFNLQLGYGDSGNFNFNLPSNHPDYGEKVTAFYYWVFPNMMFNFYPWGLSVNIVRPLKPNLTKVSFYCYIYNDDIFEKMDAAALTDKVEREDEFVVEAVHKGLQSRFYKNGRFSPKREKGVHQFHCLLNQSLSNN